MGPLTSRFRLATRAEGDDDPAVGFEWIQMPGVSVGSGIKEEAFENTVGLGKGKFGLVFAAKTRGGEARHVAIKYIPKQVIYDCKAVEKIQTEMDLLATVDHPFSVYCFGGFDTPSCVGLVMDFAVGGELYHRMKQRITMGEDEAKFYFAEIVSVLRYLHEDLGIVYRDLKPENVLIDYAGHIKICDFGFCTPASKTDPDLQDSCGTVMYIAPEVVTRLKHSFPVDWWAAGCVLVEMVTGHAPFGDSDDSTRFEIFNNITERTVRLPLLCSRALKTLVKGLLQKSQDQRFDSLQVAESAWLKDVNWKDVYARKMVPPWVPDNARKQPGCAANFVSWSLALPSTVPTSDVTGYCRPLRLPKPRGVQLSRAVSSLGGDTPKGALRKSASSAGAKKTVTLQSAPSAPAMLTPQNSSPKLRRGKSSKVAVAADEEAAPLTVNPAPVLASEAPQPKRTKSARGGAAAEQLDAPLDPSPSVKRGSAKHMKAPKAQPSSSNLAAGEAGGDAAAPPPPLPEGAQRKKKQKSQKLDRQPSAR